MGAQQGVIHPNLLGVRHHLDSASRHRYLGSFGLSGCLVHLESIRIHHSQTFVFLN